MHEGIGCTSTGKRLQATMKSIIRLVYTVDATIKCIDLIISQTGYGKCMAKREQKKPCTAEHAQIADMFK